MFYDMRPAGPREFCLGCHGIFFIDNIAFLYDIDDYPGSRILYLYFAHLLLTFCVFVTVKGLKD